MLLERGYSTLGLLDDTKVLSHTRGVPLSSIVKLLHLINEREMVSQEELTERAVEIGLKEFVKGKAHRNHTRIRHFWYSLDKLHLANIDKTGKYTLLPLGREVLYFSEQAQSNESSKDAFDSPLRRAVQESEYVKAVWLDFISEDRTRGFILLKVASRMPCIPSNSLVAFGKRRWQDSGYTIYPSSDGAWKELCLFPSDETQERAQGIILSETARKELVQGVREWCLKLRITDEVPCFESVSVGRHCVTRLVTVYAVRQILPNDLYSLADVGDFVELAIKSEGLGARIRIPQLINYLCVHLGISVDNAKGLLTILYQEQSNRFYFEGASRDVLVTQNLFVKQEDVFDFYVRIDGIWRSSILLL